MDRINKIGELYKTHQKLFFHIIRKNNWNLSNDEMRDIIHDMCFKVIKSEFDPFDARAKYYMCSALQMLLIDRLRVKKLPVDYVPDYIFDIGEHDKNYLTHEVLMKDVQKVLKPNELIIVKMIEQGYRGKEIEEELNLTDAKARKIIFDMRKRLKNNNSLHEYLN